MRERGQVPFVALVAGLLLARPLWEPAPAPGALVRVDGDGVAPAWHKLDAPRLSAALAAVGRASPLVADLPLTDGDRITLARGRVTVRRGDAEPLVGDALDLARVDAPTLQAIPGIGPAGAAAFVAARAGGDGTGLSRPKERLLRAYAAAP